MASKKTIHIEDQDVINVLQSYGYEEDARITLLTHMIDHGISINSDSFKHYHKEYEEMHAKYELAKAEFEAQYVKPLVAENENVTWKLDYNTAICTISGDA